MEAMSVTEISLWKVAKDSVSVLTSRVKGVYCCCAFVFYEPPAPSDLWSPYQIIKGPKCKKAEYNLKTKPLEWLFKSLGLSDELHRSVPLLFVLFFPSLQGSSVEMNPWPSAGSVATSAGLWLHPRTSRTWFTWRLFMTCWICTFGWGNGFFSCIFRSNFLYFQLFFSNVFLIHSNGLLLVSAQLSLHGHVSWHRLHPRNPAGTGWHHPTRCPKYHPPHPSYRPKLNWPTADWDYAWPDGQWSHQRCVLDERQSPERFGGHERKLAG